MTNMSSEKKIKHLEFIQNIITRMNTNSFAIKGWTVTLVSALFALAAQNTNNNFIFITYIAIPIFWILDGFYLGQEKQYRGLYGEISKKKEDEIDFSLDARTYDKDDSTWLSTTFSKTLNVFYLTLIAITIVVLYFIK